MGEGHPVTIWMPEDTDLLDEYDDRYGPHRRSAAIRDAMALQLTVESALDRYDFEFDSEIEKRHWVRQAIFHEAEREL